MQISLSEKSVSLNYFNYLRQHQFLYLLDSFILQCSKSIFLGGKKTRLLNKTLFGLFLLKLKYNRSKINNLNLFSVKIFLNDILKKAKINFILRSKRVGGVFYNIPMFLNPKKDILFSVKFFVKFVYGSIKRFNFSEKLFYECQDYFLEKGQFLNNLHLHRQLGKLNKIYARYLKSVGSRHKNRLSSLKFFYRFESKYPFGLLRSCKYVISLNYFFLSWKDRTFNLIFVPKKVKVYYNSQLKFLGKKWYLNYLNLSNRQFNSNVKKYSIKLKNLRIRRNNVKFTRFLFLVKRILFR